jgi:hypothetical protein
VTVFTDNAAGRLHELFTAFRRNASQQIAAEGWAPVLGVQSFEHPDFARRLARVFELPVEIENEISQVDEDEFDRDLAMRWQGQIIPGLGPGLYRGQPSADLARPMDDASLHSLEYCSFVLHRYRPQQVLLDGDLERIGTLITELQAEVQGEDGLDPDLREFLLFHAREMALALVDLPMRGPTALEEALDRTVGAVQRRSDLVVKSDTSTGAWAKFGNLVVAVAAVLQIATSSLMLPGQIRQELDGTPTPAPVVRVVVESNAPDAATPVVRPDIEKVPEGHSPG